MDILTLSLIDPIKSSQEEQEGFWGNCMFSALED